MINAGNEQSGDRRDRREELAVIAMQVTTQRTELEIEDELVPYDWDVIRRLIWLK